MADKQLKKAKSSRPPARHGASPKQKPVSRSSTFPRQLLLTGIAVLLLVAFFSIGYTRKWFGDKIPTYWNEFMDQKDKMKLDYRMTTRFGNSYTITKSIAEFFSKRGNSPTLLLVAPHDYLSQNKIEYKAPEPAIFYYFTGLKTVWANSEEAHKANWFLSVARGQLMLDSVMNKRQLDSVITYYRKYKISL